MLKTIFDTISVWFLPFFIILILVFGLFKKIPLYEAFTEGAKDGLKVSFNIFPYLVAIIVAVAMLRASGFFEIVENLSGHFLMLLKIPVDVVPIMFTRSLSGSATLGLLSEVANNTGVTSYATKLAAVMVGSSETTFYVLAVYFGAVGIKKFRHALLTGVLADIVGIIAAIVVCNIIF